MKRTLYMYAMTCDSNFAPCIQDGLLTLACCKGGIKGSLRKSVGKSFLKQHSDEEFWVMGVRGKGLKLPAGIPDENLYNPVYIAKVTNVLSMVDYYKDKRFNGRADHSAYVVGKNADGIEDIFPVQDPKMNAHANSPEDYAKDKGGEYVLLSDDYMYFGKMNRKYAKELRKALPRYYFDSSVEDAPKKGIDKHFFGYNKFDLPDNWDETWKIFVAEHQLVEPDEHLSPEFIPGKACGQSCSRVKDPEGTASSCAKGKKAKRSSCAGGK